MRSLWLLVHLLAAIVWIGGMIFAVACLRPSLAALAPADRQALMTATLGRFLDWVAAAIVALWLSGIALLAATPAGARPVSWSVMAALAAVMTAVFAVLRWRHLPALRQARAAGDAKAAAGSLARIHRLVVTNLLLGLIAIVQLKLL